MTSIYKVTITTEPCKERQDSEMHKFQLTWYCTKYGQQAVTSHILQTIKQPRQKQKTSTANKPTNKIKNGIIKNTQSKIRQKKKRKMDHRLNSNHVNNHIKRKWSKHLCKRQRLDKIDKWIKNQKR